jgi:diphthamide biosynthesis protein 4
LSPKCTLSQDSSGNLLTKYESTMTIPPSHYEILGLPKSLGDSSIPSAQQLKAAYRRALLHHHPDKIRKQASITYERDGEKFDLKQDYTIDQITEAYAILSVPKLRSEYDRALKLRSHSSEDVTQRDLKVFRTGSETIDLDDLAYDEAGEFWYKSCRCGEDLGFSIREADLDEASDIGELHVGCKGCSLWLRILFGVVEGGEDGQLRKHG